MDQLTEDMIRNAGMFELTQLKEVYSGKELQMINDEIEIREIESPFQDIASVANPEIPTDS